jgi:hypothetical protein
MAFQFAYSLDGNHANIIKDFPVDTLANYGTGGQKKGDLVNQVSGLVRRMGAASGTALGVLEGGEFIGLVAQGQPYAASKAGFTDSATNVALYPNGVGKVRIDKSSVYKVPVYTGGATDFATNAHIGGSYAINVVSGDQQVDLNVTATPSVKIIERSADGTFVFVTLI